MDIKEKINDIIYNFSYSTVGIFLITFIVIIGIMFFWGWGTLKVEKYLWNEGVCISCGVGHYEYEGTETTKNGIYYIYSCDKCGHHEAFSKDMK